MIFGPRYACLRCPDFDVCFKCYPRANLHGVDHAFREVRDEEASEAVAFIEESEGSEG
jgi:hypothetical protein